MFIWLLYEFISSLIITGLFIALSSYFASTWIMGLGMAMCAILFVWIKRKKINYPIEKQFSYYIIYTILVLCICLFISKGAASHQIWAFYNYALIPSIPTRLFAALYNDTMVYYLLPLLWQGAIYIGMVLVNKDYHWKHHLKLILSLGIGLSLCGVILYQRRQVVLPGHGFDYSGGYSSVDLKEYDVINQNNKLAQLDEPSAFIIHDPEEMPVLDGEKQHIRFIVHWQMRCMRILPKSNEIDWEWILQQMKRTLKRNMKIQTSVSFHSIIRQLALNAW